jgi:hypothetical protein
MAVCGGCPGRGMVVSACRWQDAAHPIIRQLRIKIGAFDGHAQQV